MIFQPRVGQNVRIHYAKSYANEMPYHGKTGVIADVAKGKGPRNAGVEIEGKIVVVPRGNLVAIGGRRKTPTEVRV